MEPSTGPASAFGMLRQLLAALDWQRRLQLAGLFGLMLLSALAELVTLGAILPFVGALVQPELVLENSFAQRIAAWLGITTPQEMLLPLTLGFAGAAAMAAAIRILVARTNATIAYSIGADLGLKVFSSTLNQPYERHVLRNSSEVISGVTRKVDGIVRGVLVATLNMLSSGLLFAVALGALLVINPQATLIVMAVFGSFYTILVITMRRRLRRYGQVISKAEGQVFRALNEGLGGIRDVILYDKQAYYGALYRKADVALREAQANSLFISQFPRYALEGIAMILIALVAYLAVAGPDGGTAALPTLAALALGGQRMLPALQMVYVGWSAFTNTRPILADVLELMRMETPEPESQAAPELSFRHEIRLEDIAFRYAGAPRQILDGISLTIPKGQRIGLIGTTGAGKSTLVDVIIGLLLPTSGRLAIDGVALEARTRRAWQNRIALVPQMIHLIDGSFSANIALGEDPVAVDIDAVRRAARRARIADVIEAGSDGYDGIVGENGIKLSGGQRQRLGIARALYREPDVLVFDEATSALDSETEAAVIETLNELDAGLTVVMIAHRLTTLRNCDVIVKLEAGRVVWTGSFAELQDPAPEVSAASP